MVSGINSFREWFHGYESNYVVIGGTACDLLMGEVGEDFRVTRDIDMVLIAEELNAEFGNLIWEYVKTAGYEQRLKSNGTPEYYRFVRPKSSEFPTMIELFSRRIEGILLPTEATLTPLPIDDCISSLSAILLDEEYYSFLKNGVTISGGVSILRATHLIPLKMKAWLDLTKRKIEGAQIDSKNIRKHKNDILRLSELLPPDNKIVLPDDVANDMRIFLADVDNPEKFLRTAAAYDM